MKKILFFLVLFCSLLYAQGVPRMITVVGDTTDLKLISGSGIVLLLQFAANNKNGGGLFHRNDIVERSAIQDFEVAAGSGAIQNLALSS